MGSYSNISGQLEFSRSLNRKEAEPIRLFLKSDDWNVYALAIELDEHETDEGVLIIAQATGLEPLYEEEIKAYEWERVLREAVALLPADVTVSGYFERSGEQTPDLERLYVKGRDVVSVKPEIVWPEP